MSTALRVTRANKLVTVQDRGRQGAMRFGVSQSGPMDWVRYRMATTLVDAPAAFEVGIAGAEFRAEGRVRLAVAGPGFTVRIEGAQPAELAPPCTFTLDAGETLSIVPGGAGMWAYVAADGIEFGPPLMGSYATNARTGLGAADLTAAFVCRTAGRGDPELFDDLPPDDRPLGLLPGPQHHLFGEEARQTFAAEPYRLTDALDRMGYRLEGPKLPAETHDIISDGIVEGAIQVPGNGQPIVLCADRQPTGGYPKIAILVAADRPRLTQCRPGDEIRFAWLSADEARARRKALVDWLSDPQPRRRMQFSAEFLASKNLIGGVWEPGREG